MRPRSDSIFGVGVNDANYLTYQKINGTWTRCAFYQVWLNMLARCYSSKYQNGRPAYAGCTVYPGWHTFSAFKAWMEKQDWQGKQLDKDLLVKGNKTYSPEACVFVNSRINKFLISQESSRGKYPAGVNWSKSNQRLQVRCSNPFTEKVEHIGYFDCPNKAHLAWLIRKHELACRLADLETDNRIATALRTRFLQPAEIAA